MPDLIISDWNKNHGMLEGVGVLPLIHETSGIASSQMIVILGVTVGLGLLLIFVDLVLADSDIWPKKQWDMDNTLCYDEMFMEPPRNGRVIRRPGNALSNLSYFMASICILSVSHKPICDVLFGVIVMILFISSFLWHATHAPWVHYVDLWSMDLSIFYLILRSICQFFCDSSSFDLVCTILYIILALNLGHFYLKYGTCDQGLHGACPISARARLAGTSNVFGKGHLDLLVKDTCLFISLPVFYCSLPYFLLTPYYDFSLTLAKWACRTLIIGWSYRCLERFVLDGCLIMNLVKDRSTLAAAILSPTAILHFATGFTILFGYMLLYSLDDKK
mmetsp:Transcript_7528/g.11487  ORF Transcript_7528/g.11487 Transcript_7528/m.11487 type:complete len:333 (+) Transcript_7528:160-1158(+)